MKKKLIIGFAVLLALAIYYGWNKAKKLMQVFEKITIEPVFGGVSNIDINLNRIKFDLDILLTNPTMDDFEVSGYGLAKLQTINLFYNKKFMATAAVPLTEISLPAKNQMVIKYIPIIVPTNFLIQNPEIVTNFDTAKLSVTGILEVAGNQIFIGE